MRLKTGNAALVFLLTLVLSGSPAIALDPIPKQSGFSGYIQPGAGYMSIKSNTVAKVLNFDLSDQRIGDLDDEPRSACCRPGFCSAASSGSGRTPS